MLDEFVKDYLLECQEGLVQFESNLLLLEKDPGSTSILSTIFRVVHSIKGASGFLGFEKMAAVTHEGEELLGKLREGTIRTSPEIVNGLLTLIDAMRTILVSIEATRVEGDRDDSALIARLKALQGGPAPASPPAAVEPAPDRAESPAEPDTTAPSPAKPAARARKPKPSPSPPTAPPVEPGEGISAAGPSLGESSIRVDVGLLDRLMNLVGELVLTRNQILRCSIVSDEAIFQAGSQRLNLITTELQEAMMRTRMQPIRTISSKLPRVVRDLALACGKRATIEMEGEDTELDKTLSEAIKDPITHIVRNAIDHGVEPPEARLAKGKPAEGRLRLRAFHEGGMVNIELSDDGGGIDPARIRRKAVERGWLTDDQAAQWPDRELLALIFRPGFSTAESLTMISGRGVGMDVVKSRVESIGGSVEASSQVGVGTTIKMKIPLTLTIINALIVDAGSERFAIPQVNLVELIRLKGESAASGLILMQGARTTRYRGKLLPLLDLDEILGVGADAAGGGREAINIVVLQADRRKFGLIVDRIDDAQEIVVRPLARQLKGIACLAGATIMGDGKIALILDVFGLARGLDDRRDAAGEAAAGEDRPASPPGGAGESLVILRGTDGGPMALPLAEVERLETFPRSAVEWVAGRPFVQYRLMLLELIDVAARLRGEVWLGPRDKPDDGPTWQVVIHSHRGMRAGLVFDRVVDIVDDRLDVRSGPTRPGVRFMAVVQGQAAEVLDVGAIREAIHAAATATAGGA